ncbi:VanZ family protein [Bifidobacterium samirii]|uniref:Teicoplanin resistance protein VanZ n=1 Tax=Bifidobacterium samirii TaxID=2306974 RepID=A0A430FVQ2_9BIFI|nr:VanZ family protein [Bifidobacterium samirii]RSX57794.1 teicoplanin resistance protein VanZ [Bifidobacterium samirii]
MGYLAYFSRPFLLAVALWPFVSAMLTVPVLALLYHRDNRLRFTQVVVAYGSVLYAIGLMCFTMYPMPDDPVAYCAAHHLHPQLNPLQFVADIRSDGTSAIMQLALNVLFFIPLGFIAGRVFRWRLRAALPFGFLVSLLIETMQLTGMFGLYPCSYRLFDVDDLATNTLGTLAGFGIAMLLNRLFPIREADRTTVTSPGFVRRLIAYALDCAAISLSAGTVTAIATLVYNDLILPPDAPWQSIPSAGRFSFADLMFGVAFAAFEIVVPVMRGGRTLGGSFTHMTCETRPRSGWRRLLFYVVRSAVMFVAVFSGRIPWSGLLMIALAVFYAVRHQMPYDLLPASPSAAAADDTAHTTSSDSCSPADPSSTLA